MVYKVFTVFLLFVAVLTAKPKGGVQMHASCEGKTFCMATPEDYPLKKFQKIMQDMRMQIIEDKKEVGHRQSDQVINELDYVCRTKSYYLRPIYQIVDTEGHVRYVAQIPEKFSQKYSVAECERPGRVVYPDGGDLFLKEDLTEFNVTCVETRVDHKFLVLSHDEKRVEVASVLGDVPVGCVCRYS